MNSRLKILTNKSYWTEALEGKEENKTSNDEFAEDIANKVKEALSLKYNATDLWNKATKEFDHALQTNGYWKALRDLQKLGIIDLDEL